MNVVYRVEWTEYELRFGRMHDGVTYALSEALLDKEVKRRESFGDPSCYSKASSKGLAIISDELAKKIHENAGIFTTIHSDDPGMLGIFKPRDPKANIETFRQGVAKAA